MTKRDLSLLDAIRIGMEAEKKAAAFYADAAQQTGNPLGRRLLEQLAEFERHHYRELAALERSLREQGTFIEYTGRTLEMPAPSEVEDVEESNKMSLMGIITKAIETERKAEKRYTDLVEQTTDPAGQSMFERLADEEHTHYLILSKAYWSLNNQGVWNWSV
ncbi:MAG TPA: hypothetical protein EYH30_10475 [Anaerolineales bacterium]|nr:hypothetical protein [Anaerolineae bacterium]HIQ02527.1 hypothetical protein [Anaerolineales bacterium]